MAQRIIAPGGGNWGSTSTWVGGVIPTSSDYVTGDATSGSITLDVNTTIQYLDMSAYTNTFTLNAGRTVTCNLNATTSTFNPLMSWAGTGTVSFSNNTSISGTSTTSRIPNLTIGSGTRTLASNIYCVNLTAGSATCNGNKIFASGNVTPSSFGFNGTTTVEMDGTGQFIAPPGAGNLWGSCPIVINTTGTITLNPEIRLYADTSNPNVSVTYTNGTVVNPRILLNLNATNANFNAELGTTYNWDLITTNYAGGFGSSTNTTITSNNSVSFNNIFAYGTRTDYRPNDFIFAGTATNVNINTLTPFYARGAESGTFTPEIIFSLTPNYNINRLFVYGSPFLNLTLKSAVNGSQAKINLGDNKNSPLIYANVFDINASGGQSMKTWNGTVSGSTNVTSYTTDIFPTLTGSTGTSVYASIN